MTSPADLPQGPDFPAPVTFERVVTIAGEGYAVDGARLRRRWQEAEMRVWVPDGEQPMLLFRTTRLAPPLPVDRRGAAGAFINDWHRDRLWPTVIVTGAKDGLQILTQLAVDTGAGLTDDQLRTYLHLAEATMRQATVAFEESMGLRRPPSAGPEAG